MGHVYNVLGKNKITGKPNFFANRLVVEQCENIHLHYRNMRLEFTDEEFLEFADTITEGAKKLRELKKEGK